MGDEKTSILPLSELMNTIKDCRDLSEFHQATIIYNEAKPEEQLQFVSAILEQVGESQYNNLTYYHSLHELNPIIKNILTNISDLPDNFGQELFARYQDILPHIQNNESSRYNMVSSIETILLARPELAGEIKPLASQIVATEFSPETLSQFISTLETSLSPEDLIEVYKDSLTTPLRKNNNRNILENSDELLFSFQRILPATYEPLLQPSVDKFMEALNNTVPQALKSSITTRSLFSGLRSLKNINQEYVKHQDQLISRILLLPEEALDLAPFFCSLSESNNLDTDTTLTLFQDALKITDEKTISKLGVLVELSELTDSNMYSNATPEDFTELENLLSEDDPIIHRLLSLMLQSEENYRLQLGMICSATPLNKMTPNYQEQFENSYHPIATTNTLTLEPYYEDWGLCDYSESRLESSIFDTTLMTVSDHLLLKMNGRMTALCTQSFTTAEGKLFIEGNWYSPTHKNRPARQEIEQSFFDGKGRVSGENTTWAIMRKINPDAFDYNTLATLARLTDTIPEVYTPAHIDIGDGPISREQYRELVKESHTD